MISSFQFFSFPSSDMAIFFNFSNGNFHFKNESFHFLSFQISKMKSFIFFISNFLGIFQKISFPFGGMAKKIKFQNRIFCLIFLISLGWYGSMLKNSI
jgi:hypothetical protein